LATCLALFLLLSVYNWTARSAAETLMAGFLPGFLSSLTPPVLV
jgi:hypothetical protein